MKMRACVTLLAMLLSAGAWGQYTGEARQPAVRADFLALDRNRDGYISKVEALANPEIHKRFAAFDADKDGRLSEAEYTSAMEDNETRILQDSVITARVKAALLAERGIPSLSISVETYEGGVQLNGFVNMAEIVSRAGRITASVAGVRTVHNNIAVRQ
ncbi:MAG TPA: BON domain-containing protein [Burkholderiales bacterium]|jgi:hyperosmotically inducible protein|nr:BON domain-containing protein [Burkholderiales bacterium]